MVELHRLAWGAGDGVGGRSRCHHIIQATSRHLRQSAGAWRSRSIHRQINWLLTTNMSPQVRNIFIFILNNCFSILPDNRTRVVTDLPQFNWPVTHSLLRARREFSGVIVVWIESTTRYIKILHSKHRTRMPPLILLRKESWIIEFGRLNQKRGRQNIKDVTGFTTLTYYRLVS